MGTVKVEELSLKAFQPFGYYANMIDPDTEKIGQPPIDFYRDMVQQDMGGRGVVSFSICRVEKRDLVIDVTEYHTSTGEAALPLDNDTFMHVGPATSAGDPPPLRKIRVFRVPRGTILVIKPGIWHHAPFTANDDPANVLIVLPERTYANDCVVVDIEGDDVIKF